MATPIRLAASTNASPLQSRKKISSALADWAGDGAAEGDRKERRASQPKTGLFSLRKRTSSAVMARPPAPGVQRTSGSKLEVPDLLGLTAAAGRAAVASPPASSREDHKGLVHNARDDVVKAAMKDTVKLQGTIDKAEKDRQVLRSKYESATSTAAFLKKKNDEGQARLAQLRAATADYQRMVAEEQKAVAALNQDLAQWNAASGDVALWMRLASDFLSRLDSKFGDRILHPDSVPPSPAASPSPTGSGSVPVASPAAALAPPSPVGAGDGGPLSPGRSAATPAKSSARPRAPPPAVPSALPPGLPADAEAAPSSPSVARIKDGASVKKIIRIAPKMPPPANPPL